MKKYILLLAVVLSFSACKEIDKLTQFEMEYSETVVVPSFIGINLPFNILTPNITTNSESTFEVNDTRKDLIEKAVLTGLDLTLTSPEKADFNFLNSIEVYISAEGLEEVTIAWQSDIPDDTKSLTLDVTGVDLQEYIKKDSLSLRLRTKTGKLLTSEHTIAVHCVFFIDAKILGI